MDIYPSTHTRTLASPLTGGDDGDPALFVRAAGGAKGVDRTRDTHELTIACSA